MRFINIASSSDGNCTYVSDGKVNILIDCGLSCKRITEDLEKINVTFDNIDAIFLTHEHIDHYKGLEIILKKHPNIHVFGLKETLDFVFNKNKDLYSHMNFNIVNYSKIVKHDFLDNKNSNMIIIPFKSYHDVPCCFYKIIINDTKFVILTDCGHYDKGIIKSIMDANYIMLESNYDEDLIDDVSCTYDFATKDRIKGKNGHLSNTNCADIIMEIHNDNLKKVCLSHISHNSNNEDNAYKKVIEHLNIYMNDSSQIPNIIVASRKDPTVIFDN